MISIADRARPKFLLLCDFCGILADFSIGVDALFPVGFVSFGHLVSSACGEVYSVWMSHWRPDFILKVLVVAVLLAHHDIV